MQIGLLTAMASVLFVIESMVPLPMPWMRIGLANVLTLLALTWWGGKEALLITLLRVFIGGLISGRFMQPLFFMALAGGVGSTLCMWLIMKYSAKFSLLGVSILGACTKNLIQLAVAGLILIQQIALVAVLPFVLISSLISGLLVGFLTIWLEKRLTKLLF